MLKEADFDLLRKIAEADDKMVACKEDICFVGSTQVAKTNVLNLLRVTALSDTSTSDDLKCYKITGTGRQLLFNPDLQNEIIGALDAGSAFTIGSGGVAGV